MPAAIRDVAGPARPDDAEFIDELMAELDDRVRHVIFVGVSEGPILIQLEVTL